MSMTQLSHRFAERLRHPDEEFLASLHAAALAGPFIVVMPALFGYLFRTIIFYFWGRNLVVRAFDLVGRPFLAGLPYLVFATFAVCKGLHIYARIRLAKIHKAGSEARDT